MPRKQASALEALIRQEEEEHALARRGEAIRQSAALELGLTVLAAGGGALGHAGVRRAIETALADTRSPRGRADHQSGLPSADGKVGDAPHD